MTKKNIELSPEAINAVQALQHSAGTLDIYCSTLGRLYNYVLHQADEIGMSDREALSTLRVIDLIRQDLVDIANRQPACYNNQPDLITSDEEDPSPDEEGE